MHFEIIKVIQIVLVEKTTASDQLQIELKQKREELEDKNNDISQLLMELDERKNEFKNAQKNIKIN